MKTLAIEIINKKYLFFLFITALFIRSLVFYFYIDPGYRYNQPDTKDYHVCAINMAQGKGMKYYNSDQPIFWRTPGYPFLLAPFYYLFSQDGKTLNYHKKTHQIFLWLQILICSLLPILIFFLALLITNNILLSWISAIISTVHLGFVISSTYLMTDAFATLLFLLFIYFLFKALPIYQKSTTSNLITKNLIFSALSLSALTWLRPMGIYLSFFVIILIAIHHITWPKKARNILIFILIFFGTISPWYIRNYNLTGKLFFCPLWGPYTLTFLVPKTYQRLTGKPLIPCINKFLFEAKKAFDKDVAQKKAQNSPYISCKELICAEIANPLIKAHPFYFLLDWTIEIIKTTCDLYSGHLVNFARNDFFKEPPVEFLGEKLRDCLYREKLPTWMRIIAWVEGLFHFLLLLGILGGIFSFILLPLFYGVKKSNKKRLNRWIKVGIFITLVIGMTGGFGYARLRLPVEALIIILALDFWLWLGNTYYNKKLHTWFFTMPLP